MKMAKKVNAQRTSTTVRKELLIEIQIRLAELEAARKRYSRVIH
jgi:hypothetical protein